jgi:hypothetical protein
MFNFISKILFKPLIVKCSLAPIIIATFLKSEKSKLFSPCIWYFSKKGIMISINSEIFVIARFTVLLDLDTY